MFVGEIGEIGIDGGGKLQAVGEEEALEESRAVVMSTVERRF